MMNNGSGWCQGEKMMFQRIKVVEQGFSCIHQEASLTSMGSSARQQNPKIN
ncbi:hypothetical protein HanRHA438_Chr12g0537141 [Helianthus annuus]|nr:hypothetical protein HanRHA438_Chr12g0537141 [Helianthus annuus]